MNIMLEKIIMYLLVLAVFSLIYWPTVYHPGFFIPLRYDSLFLIAIIFFGFYILKKLFYKEISLQIEERNIYVILAIFLLSITLTTLNSLIKHNIEFSLFGISTLLKVFLGGGVFVTVYYFLLRSPNKKHYKIISWAIITSHLLLIPFLFFPQFTESMGCISATTLADGGRFQGFTANPNSMNLILITAFAYAYSFFLHNAVSNKKNKMMIYGILTMCFSALVFWSQSRSYAFAMLIIIIFAHFFYGNSYKISRLKSGCYLLIGLTIMLISITLIPSISKQYFIYERLLGSHAKIMQPSTFEEKNTQFSIKNQVINKIQLIFKTLYHDPRANMWHYHLSLISKYPFGIGVNHYPKFGFHTETEILSPLFIFNIWILGGIFAISSLFMLYAKAICKFNAHIKTNSELFPYQCAAYLSMIAAFFISSFYGLPVDYPGFWVVFALTLV